MHLIVTRSFPPELGGMQSLMWGLARELSKNFMIKVFADHFENHKDFDEQASFSIERVGGIKMLRKYRKAQLINEFIKENKVERIIADHWKSLELIKSNKKKYCLIHSKEINHPKGTSLNKRVLNVLNNVEKVIANSEFTKNLAIDCGINENNIIVYGESLGTGITTEISQNKNFAGLILESPFTSMIDAGKDKYPYLPVKFLLKDKYESDKKIKNIKSPILVMHGKVDKIVPFYMGKKIYELANKPKYFYFSEYDDHMMEYNENLLKALKDFIYSLN